MFETFLGLIDKAHATDRLNAGPATVFMPTDAAFKHLTSTQRDLIAALSSDDAKRFVSHFVVPGVALRSNNIDQDITAEDGTSYNVTWFMGRLSLRDHQGPAPGPLAFVIDGDNPAGPGMIDAVDHVLMPAFLNQPAPADLPAPVAAASPPAPPLSATPAPTATAPIPAPAAAAPPTPPASTSVSNSAPTDAISPEPKLAPPAPPPQPQPTPATTPTVIALPTKPDLNITTADLRGWPVRTSGTGPTGKVDRVVVGVSSGRITGIMATFGGFFGIGGKHAFIAWPLMTVDPQGKAIRVRMTADGLKSAPSSPPAP